jgi:MFS family permease
VTGASSSVRAAFRSGRLRRVLLAFFAFSVAEWACWIAVLVWAYDRAGVGAASAVSVVQLVPAVLVAPFAATLGDRLRREVALAVGYAAQGTAMLTTGALLAADAPFGLVAAGAAVLTCTVTLTRPVHNALLPTLASTPGELVAGNSFTSTAEGLGAFVGPFACALIITRGGAEAVVAGFGVVMLAAALLVLGVATGPPAAADRPAESTVRAALGGLRELRREPAAAVLVGMVAGQYVVVGAMDILLLVLALDVLGTDTSGPGLLGSALGVGGVLGGLVTMVLVGRRRLGPALAGGLLGTGVPLLLIPLTGTPASVAVLLAVSGAGKAFFDVSARTLLQRVVPDRVLSRVFGVQEAAMTAALAIGAALAPAAVSALGRQGALIATGALLPLAGLVAWRWLGRLDALSPAVGPHLGLLARVPMLRPAGPPVLEQLARAAVELRLAPGVVAVREGEPGDRFYVVASGRVVVSRHGHEVRELGPGESFGEIALLRDGARTATVTAAEPTLLVSLHRTEFLRAVSSGESVRAAAEQAAQTYLDADAGDDDGEITAGSGT